MRITIQKKFWIVLQQECWLNELSQRGFHLIRKRAFWRYDFVHDAEIRYTYYIDCLYSKSFCDFLKNNEWIWVTKSLQFKIFKRKTIPADHLLSVYLEKHYIELAKGFIGRLILSAILTGSFISVLLNFQPSNSSLMPEWLFYDIITPCLLWLLVVEYLLDIAYCIWNIIFVFHERSRTCGGSDQARG